MYFLTKKIVIVFLVVVFTSLLFLDSSANLIDESESSFAVARADCPSVVGANTLELNPPGPFALPAHQTVLFESSIKDSSGNEINADPHWGVTNGTIIPSIGFGQATFTPHAKGQVTIWACIEGINTTASVTVVQGNTEQLILESNVENISADQVVNFNLSQIDIRGNSEPATPPLNNWTLPEGSDLDVANLEWTPKYVGHHFISVNYDGLVATIELNVSHGMGINANIVSPLSTLTADEDVDISLELMDSRGNTWIVEGDWMLTDPDASQSWLNKNGTIVTFDAHKVGNWIVQAKYEGSDSLNTLLDLQTFTVTSGELFQIIITGNGATMTVDDELDLDPKIYDYDMNELEGIPITWEINGEVKTIELELSDFIFNTEVIGQYEIQALAGGKYASISFDVIYGAPINLQTTGEESSAIVVKSGGEALVYVEAADQYGNSFPVDVEWDYDENAGSFEPSSKGSGWYLFTPGELQGFILFNATYNGINHGFIIDIQQGTASQLLISFSGDLVVGNDVEVTVYAIDSAGSKIAECDSTSITEGYSSTAGKISLDGNMLSLNLDESGQQHSITINCLGLEETTFFDVQSSLFGGAFGSSNSAILILSFFVMCIIALLLFVITKRNREIYYDEDYEDEDTEPENVPLAVAFTPPPLLPTQAAQIHGINTAAPPPIAQQPLASVPPPPPIIQNVTHSSVGKGVVAPISPSNQPSTAEGVWIQPQTDYGWNEKQSPMFVNEPAMGGYGWEESKKILPPAPKDKLSGALSNLTPKLDSDLENISVIETNNLDSNIDEKEESQKNESSNSEDENGWGGWDTDNWGSPEWKDKAVERAVEESKKDDYDRGGTKDSSMPVFNHVIGGRDEIGPLDEFGKVMAPLPGTNVGTSGWYLGSDGTPSQWEFRPHGWKKLQ